MVILADTTEATVEDKTISPPFFGLFGDELGVLECSSSADDLGVSGNFFFLFCFFFYFWGTGGENLAV